MAAAIDAQVTVKSSQPRGEGSGQMYDPIAVSPSSAVEDERGAGNDNDSMPNDPLKDMKNLPGSLDGTVMYNWMKDMNTRIASLERAENEKDDETDDEAADKKMEDGFYDMFHTVPEVRECDWEHFKNKYSDEECNYSIDIYMLPEDRAAEVEAEHIARLPPETRLNYMRSPRLLRRIMKANEDKWKPGINRVRINSGIILAYLDKTNVQSSWSTLPHTFMAPFKTFIHFHSAMEADLRVLEEKYGPNSGAKLEKPPETTGEDNDRVLTGNDTAAKSQGVGIASFTEDEDKSQPINPQQVPVPPIERHESYLKRHEIMALMDSEQAYKDMKLYVNFINERIMPTYRMFEQADYSTNMKVRYDELWSLFRIGELVYQRANPKTESSVNNAQGPQAAATTHRLWRLYFISQQAPTWKVNQMESVDNDEGLVSDDADKKRQDNFSAYSLDFDGEKYSAVNRTFSIPYYEGEKEIHELPIFPLRFMKDGNAILEKLKQRGNTFRELLSKGKVAMAYDGWTLIHDPTGDVMTDSEGDEMATPEHIDSDVIIDFREAFLTFPHWEPEFSTFSKTPIETRTLRDPFTTIQWADPERSKQVHCWREMVVDKESIDKIRWGEFAETDSYIYERSDDVSSQVKTDIVLSDEDLALLPSRLFAYALRDRKFVVIDMAHLKAIPSLLNQFNDLKIPERHKKMILSIVYEHFEKKKARQAAARHGLETHDQDFIRGKGRGIVILLHGAPGVGKTATAEAVAHAQSKPLFPITCGDLGTTPEVVEERLQETFRLANLWDCILLMDEAEIFLSQRQKNDDSISRNAMVSVFLRTLEYYPGILFLTTNRPGALDEAVKSRVHLSLRYPALELSETIAIFRMNLNRLKVIEDERARLNGEKAMVIKEDDILAFASKHFHEDASARWNGRQIRNAFQIAASLAHYQRHIDGSQQHYYIGMEHFEDVAKASNEYDRYRRELFSGKDDDELARSKEDRGYWSPDTPGQESPGYMQHSTYRGPTSYGRYSTPPRR
ncbi:hypothetical protein F5B22DRAFT_594834 [Xylaria bambusicola]|uniref:uncharacterized protein n=1 Tax=Xylaria bambusicola TaxID=326684 RepID=UPI002007BAA9|nr:uncharacterized protein F5B22DRAFT_594834 [Xylaria bambusicola]KAI0521952.1 hypothetical protein F5B22DRAFT_594834 [Xylaria bambusicola]